MCFGQLFQNQGADTLLPTMHSYSHSTPLGDPIKLGPRVTSPKKPKPSFFNICSSFFPYIWPLAGAIVAKKGGPLRKLARDDQQTHFGTFSF